jgi:hypothetical protein
MAHTASLVCQVSTVSGHRKNTENQALVAGTKQSRQAERAVRATQYICFCFVPASSTLFEEDISQTNMC